jgi:hypothetical protein
MGLEVTSPLHYRSDILLYLRTNTFLQVVMGDVAYMAYRISSIRSKQEQFLII